MSEKHCVFFLRVHLVFITRYRRGVFTKQILDDLHEILAKVCTDFQTEFVEFDGEDDTCTCLLIIHLK